jgi:hypothetical protein
MIANDLIIAKDFSTYSIKIIRQEKMLRDHRPECPLPRDTSDLWAGYISATPAQSPAANTN